MIRVAEPPDEKEARRWLQQNKSNRFCDLIVWKQLVSQETALQEGVTRWSVFNIADSGLVHLSGTVYIVLLANGLQVTLISQSNVTRAKL